VVQISRELMAEMIQHALAGRPNEACGLLAGTPTRATRFYPATNTEASPVRYLMDPKEQLHIMQDIEDRGWILLGIFHSHTRSAARPSQTDVTYAYYPDTLYIIASLSDPERVDVRAYHIVDGQVSEEPIKTYSRSGSRNAARGRLDY
jgi:[CysO sulfur-carrier protein]-S-L-cysteine hydrolase